MRGDTDIRKNGLMIQSVFLIYGVYLQNTPAFFAASRMVAAAAIEGCVTDVRKYIK